MAINLVASTASLSTMTTFEPPTIIPHSPTNTFTTITQPFAVDSSGVWRGVRDPDIAGLLTEQGILPEVPIETNPSFGDGSDKNVVCRWLTPSYQTVGGDNNPQYLDVGVIAFHYSGIRKVVFYLNGSSKPVEVSTVTYNPEMDASAYWVRIDSSLLTTDTGDIFSRTLNAGKPTSVEVLPHHELQAVIYPNNGKPRILVGKHNDASDGQFSYNEIAVHTDPVTGKKVGTTSDTGIRSFYFSSNTNNTLFNKSLYVDATSAGLDDASRDGSSSQPYKTIEFALKRLMTLKHVHYNPSQPSAVVSSQGDVGGGTIYLKDLGIGPERYIGHKWGAVSWNGSRAYSTFAKMRWLTVAKDPTVEDRKQAKIKGCHPQSNISLTKQNMKTGIALQLLKFDDCFIEMDWPYSEYLQGCGPVLDYSQISQGVAPDAKLQHNWKTWQVKKGVGNASAANITAAEQSYPLFEYGETTPSAYKYQASVEQSSEILKVGVVPPFQWFNNSVLDGGERNRHRIYEWAEANGMTYTTTMVPVPDFNSNLPIQFSTNKKGLFRKDGTTPAPLGLNLTSVPAIFVKAQTDTIGFTTAMGYTFEFPWTDPEGSSPWADLGNGGSLKAFVTNTLIRNINEPAKFVTDIWLNSTLDQWEGDVVKSGGIFYQMFAINGFRTHNYVNKSGAPLFRVHSDMFQTNTGRMSFRERSPGINNLIFYRYNNPSPRSKRYYDLTARHGIVGEGPLTNIAFEGQWSISGRIINALADRLHFFSIAEGGDGKTYEFFGTRYVRDIVFSDCLLKTPDGTQQTVFTCPQENLLIYNTQIVSSEPNRVLPDLNFSTTTTMGGSVYRYKDAVPSTPTLNWPAGGNNLNSDEAVHYDLAVFDNLQAYVMKEAPITSPSHPHFNTYDEQLVVYVGDGSTNPENLAKVNIDFRGRPDGSRKAFYEEPRTLISDLTYPFERVGSSIGPEQTIGNIANISFPVMKTDKPHATQVGAGTISGQPNSSTRGTWYENTSQGNVVGANYGWMPSAITYENFILTNNPDDGTTLSKINAAILNFDPGNIFLNKQSLGFANDLSNPNQRGFRNKILYRFTNFDFDGTRGEFGQVLSRNDLKAQEVGQTEGQESNNPPTPISNHPITIRLSTTDITEDLSWDNKVSGVTHGSDGIYPASDILQIPNYLEKIEEITDPNNSAEIGPSVNSEIVGNTFAVGNQGGVYVTGGVADFILGTTLEHRNSLDIKDIATIFHSKARKNNGMTMSLIVHGKSNPDSEFGEFKYLSAPQAIDTDGDGNLDIETGDDVPGEHFSDFYKKFSYIAFNSKESQISQSITSNQFSFRKSPHHTYINFSRPEMDGLSLSSALNGTSIIDMVTPIVGTKLTKIQTVAIGSTCAFNSYGTESTSATKVSGTSTASTITCKNKSLEYLGFDGNQIRFKNKTAFSMFSNTVVRYEHNGAIGSNVQDFQFDQSINDYRIEPVLSIPEEPVLEQNISLRFTNPVGSGFRNLLGYKVPTNGVRLFGGTNNIGVTAGSYIRVSGSPNNNGIYQVLSTIDGIDGDSLSNTKNNGSSEYQYLELSRTVTAQEQSVSNNIKIENVSHLPILHIKYRQQI